MPSHGEKLEESTLSDVGALLINSNEDVASSGVKSNGGMVVSNATDNLAHDLKGWMGSSTNLLIRLTDSTLLF